MPQTGVCRPHAYFMHDVHSLGKAGQTRQAMLRACCLILWTLVLTAHATAQDAPGGAVLGLPVQPAVTVEAAPVVAAPVVFPRNDSPAVQVPLVAPAMTAQAPPAPAGPPPGNATPWTGPPPGSNGPWTGPPPGN